MPWRICFELPEPVGVICIDIPVLINWRLDRPDPWISKGVLDPSSVRDLPILATIDKLASDLSNATLRKTVRAAIQGAVQQPKLKGVAINFQANK